MMTRRCIWILGLLATLQVAGPARLFAQDEPVPGKGLEVRLLAVGLLKGAENVELKSGKDQAVGPLELSMHGLSDPVFVRSRELAIAKPGSPEKPGMILGSVKLPAPGRKFLLLLTPAAERYRCRVVRLDDDAFQAGTVCFYNVCSALVGGSLGERKFVVPPDKPTIVRPPARGDKGYYQVRFFSKTSESGQTRIFADTRWPHDDRARSYVFFFQKPGSTRVSYRAVDEVVPGG